MIHATVVTPTRTKNNKFVLKLRCFSYYIQGYRYLHPGPITYFALSCVGCIILHQCDKSIHPFEYRDPWFFFPICSSAGTWYAIYFQFAFGFISDTYNCRTCVHTIRIFTWVTMAPWHGNACFSKKKMMAYRNKDVMTCNAFDSIVLRSPVDSPCNEQVKQSVDGFCC